ncbi:DUF1800 domain-containing protein [Uliginosibacterium gangwonense]|uniref:DUF1800 domain-containing protein n=1 Tax=Uliginosibacterium gangwonense TaxID=392736 RepID=UPI00037FC227|nr:DUF1800 domain-containing protein [Uliginosibacterium gangwonense]
MHCIAPDLGRTVIRRICGIGTAAFLLAACAQQPARQTIQQADATALQGSDIVKLTNRLSWGVTPSLVQHAQTVGAVRFVEEQLHPAAHPALPAEIQSRIDAMRISKTPLPELMQQMERQRRDADALTDDEAKKTAQRTYQQDMTALAREAATRSLLRDVYSPDQLQEQMVWFWMNHFNVFQYKANLRITVGDFEENAIRPHVLGHFRDLLRATALHPAMLTYLDNERNAAKQINENYAREIMELHSLGVSGGYSQADVQELARVLTGIGVNYSENTPKVRPKLQDQYQQHGLFEFNPERHDYGNKQFLGQTIQGKGLAELDEVIDRLARHPATARFLSTKLATYFLGAPPSAALVARMADTYTRSDGDIGAVLRTLFYAPEFIRSLDRGFKDPVHYVVSAVRLAYDRKPILNASPMLNWLDRMGEPFYGHLTPDGYPLGMGAWTSSGQMTTRFEIAKAIGSGSAGLFRSDTTPPVERPAFPQLANALYYQQLEKRLAPATHQALEQASSPQEWNMLYLASPEMMRR